MKFLITVGVVFFGRASIRMFAGDAIFQNPRQQAER